MSAPRGSGRHRAAGDDDEIVKYRWSLLAAFALTVVFVVVGAVLAMSGQADSNAAVQQLLNTSDLFAKAGAGTVLALAGVTVTR